MASFLLLPLFFLLSSPPTISAKLTTGHAAHRIILLLPVSSRLASNALGAGSGAGRTGRIGTSPIWHRLLGSRVAVRIKLDFTAAACQDQCTALLPTAHVVQSETFFIYDNPTMSGVFAVTLGLPGEPAECRRGVFCPLINLWRFIQRAFQSIQEFSLAL